MSHRHSWPKGDAGVKNSPSWTFHTASLSVFSRASSESVLAKTSSLFLPNYVQDKYLLHLLRSADDVSTWVAAEIVTSHTSKVGTYIAMISEPGVGSDHTSCGSPVVTAPRAGGPQSHLTKGKAIQHTPPVTPQPVRFITVLGTHVGSGPP